MNNLYYKILCIIILLFLLTGCWDFEDLNQKSILISVGVDKVDNEIQFVTEIASLTSILTGGKEEKAMTGNVYYTTSYGKNFEEARLHLNRAIPFPLFLGATRVVVFGKNFAKDSIEPYLNRIDRIYDYRKTLLPVVSRDKPEDIFKIDVDKDISVGFLIEDILYHLKTKGTALYPNVGEILSDLAFGNIGFLLPYVGLNEKAVEYLGLAVFKDAKLIDVISIEDTDGVLYLLSRKPTFTEIIMCPKVGPNNAFSFKVNIQKRNFKTNYDKENENIIIDINLELAAELIYQYYSQNFSDKCIKELEKAISQKVENEISNMIKKSQNDYKCDIFAFAKHFKSQNSKIYNEINWGDEYIKAKINVDVKTRIINLGNINNTKKKIF